MAAEPAAQLTKAVAELKLPPQARLARVIYLCTPIQYADQVAS